MNNFQRTQLKSETENSQIIKSEIIKIIKSEIYSSVNHQEISMYKIVEQLPEVLIKEIKQHIDNVYYHIGRIKSGSNYL